MFVNSVATGYTLPMGPDPRLSCTREIPATCDTQAKFCSTITRIGFMMLFSVLCAGEARACRVAGITCIVAR